MNTLYSVDFELGGRKLAIETGKLAQQANAAVTVRYGDTVVLATVCIGKEPREGIDMLPLTVDYEERLYAAGKIPGGFIRREGRPSEKAILVCRLTDRPLRPLLPKTWGRDIQIIVTALSADRENDPDILSIIGASSVLTLSEVPFAGPVSAVRIGYIDGELVINPPLPLLEKSKIDLLVVSSRDRVVMIEAGAKEAPEALILEAIQLAHKTNQVGIDIQERLQVARGRPKCEAPSKPEYPEARAAISSLLGNELELALKHSEKRARDLALDNLKNKVLASLVSSYEKEILLSEFDDAVRDRIRQSILEEGIRVNGRGLTEIRPISCEVGLLPCVHGSALFTRGETQVLTITTLGSLRMEQQLDGLGIEETKRYMHHYNFPPFSTGEVKRIGTPSRREIGHGALAERALVPVIPDEASFPYAIRLVSEVLSSSGSTSMASSCASSLSLMDAGVPIKQAVAGISIGLVSNETGNFRLLTDIEGIEDNYGDMDFKVAGTRQGITAIQLDTKIKGLTMDMIKGTLDQAREARLKILDIMQNTIATSRPNLNPNAPRMYKLMVPVDKIGTVIGPGGKTIRSIIDDTKTSIDISDDGTVLIGATNEASAQKARERIERIIRDVELGSTYTGKVTRLVSFGAFVEILPGKEGLIHISELAPYRVEKVEDEVRVGDEVTVKVISIDTQGRINLSRRALLAPAQNPSGPNERHQAPLQDKRANGPVRGPSFNTKPDNT